jgi:excinuclease ABC subunit A
MDSISYYRDHSPITDPGQYAYLYDGLPDDLRGLISLIQGQMIHRNAVKGYGVTLTRGSRSEQHLRTMRQRLARIADLSPDPLTIAREPKERSVGMCRDFAVFLVSLLRHKGVPARMRVGFADYLFDKGGFKADHWISEYWDETNSRWVLADPDIGGMPPGLLGIQIACNLFDLRRDHDFYVAGSAWQLARAGKVRSDLFRYSGHWKGFPCIRGNLLHDFQSLNRLELALFDYWDELHYKPETGLTVEDKAVLDRVAALTINPEATFDEMRAYFDGLPRTQRIYAKLYQLGVMGDRALAGTDELKPAGLERLSALADAHEVPANEAGMPGLPLHMLDDTDLPDDHPAHRQAILPAGADAIVVRGARQHNLRSITVRIPRNRLVVVTGVSGSGKSSLAFDTIYAEGQRRYVESLSSYARQFMDQMEKPQVDQITGLSPAIAIEQKAITRNPRSTVGTVTEILDYLRVLYARLGTPHCPQCGRAVQPQSAQQIANRLARLRAGTRFQILAPLARHRKGTHAAALKQALKDGFPRARIDGETTDLAAGVPQLDKDKKHTIELIIDRLVAPDQTGASEEGSGFAVRIMDSVETALKAGGGTLIVALDKEEILLSEHNACPECETSFPRLEPHLFSFNSPLGMCDECNGLGVKLQVDPDLIIANPDISLMDGACRWYGNLRKKGGATWHSGNLRAIAKHFGVDIELPWKDLPEQFRHALLHGSQGERIRYTFHSETPTGTWHGESDREMMGIIFHINRLFRQTKSEQTRRWYMSFMSQKPCPSCHGERLNPEARYATVDGKRLPELTSWSIEAVHNWISSLPARLDEEQRQIGLEMINEIRQRLGFLRNVGLHYLTLDRSAPTLSSGEGQRIRLASQIGSGLVGVLYILDEPSIGLHSRDQRSLLDTLVQLRDIGNTILVVEHDRATMMEADWIIDLGPGPGTLGGEVVAAGTPDDLMCDPESLTGRYLSGELAVTAPEGEQHRPNRGWLTVRGARLHNLKNIDVRFPLGNLICITGVSGSGKSSLIGQTLYPALMRALHGSQTMPGPHNGVDGLERIDKVINITQEPIGRNPRSNPGTYVGVLNEIRAVFATTPEARALGFGAGRFSFNVKGGRCEECQGYGFRKVEMHFLADVWVRCKACEGKRFNRQTLGVTYKGKTIADVLDMDVREALSFFENYPRIRRILQTLDEAGLGYIKLGQSAVTLSGGEAQRVKLARELSRVATGDTIYILDEPTTGLHFADIQRLLEVLHHLTEAGNTVIVIEHNLDVIKTAAWIVDMGPEGGERGGQVIAEGSPEQVATVEASYTGTFLRDVLGAGNVNTK